MAVTEKKDTHWSDFFSEYGDCKIYLNSVTAITIEELYRLFMERHEWEED